MYLVAEAGRDALGRVLGSMWGRLVRCEGRGAQDRAGLPSSVPPALPPPARHPQGSQRPSPASPRALAPWASRGGGAWGEASSLLGGESFWVGNDYGEEAHTWWGHRQAEQPGGWTHSRAERGTEGQRERDADGTRGAGTAGKQAGAEGWLLTWVRQGWQPPEVRRGPGGALWEG